MCQFFESFIQYILIIFTPSKIFSQTHLPLYPLNFVPFFLLFFFLHQIKFVLFKILGCVVFHWNTIDLPGSIFLQETVSQPILANSMPGRDGILCPIPIAMLEFSLASVCTGFVYIDEIKCEFICAVSQLCPPNPISLQSSTTSGSDCPLVSNDT